MFAFPKLIFLFLVVGGLWIFYRWLNIPTRKLQRRRAARPPQAISAEDLVACGVCGSYVAAYSPACSRADCPRPY